MKQVLIAHTADFDLPTTGSMKNMHFNASVKNEEIAKALTQQEFEHVFIDEQFERAISLCRKVAIRFPLTEITIMLNRHNTNFVKSFIQAGASNYFFKSEDMHEPMKQIYSFVQKSAGSENSENGDYKAPKGLIIADASSIMDIQLRIELTNKGYRLFEASNITETVYFIKSKDTQDILIDKSVLKKNPGFLKSLILFSGSHGLKILVLGKKKPANSNYIDQNTQIEYINESETTDNIYKQIIERLN